MIDSNDPWISLDKNKQPLSIEAIQLAANHHRSISWDTIPPTSIYLEPFAIFYGLYSRHGRFYPPYNAIPDVNYAELIQNLL